MLRQANHLKDEFLQITFKLLTISCILLTITYIFLIDKHLFKKFYENKTLRLSKLTR